MLLGLLVPIVALARSPVPPTPSEAVLTIHAALDRSVFAPVLEAFRQRFPSIAIDYHDLNSLELHRRLLHASADDADPPDLVLSSAIDLQIKLVNDGHARAHESSVAHQLPDWAVWRNEAFGFTFEPAVMVYNKALIPPRDVPRTRAGLIELLRRQRDQYRGRVATYDPTRSGVGYLFATQDNEQSSGFWDLVQAFALVDVRLHDTTEAMLDGIASGDYLLGYNLIGSYALARAMDNPDLGIILLEDYTLVMSRIAFIPRQAPHPELAGLLLDFLLAEEGQQIIADRTGLYAIHPQVRGPFTAARLYTEAGDSLRPIRIGPGLLVYLDRLKQNRFLERWQLLLAFP
jgi:ABC-type Fe3+ transport system substrate-binding protein